MNDFYGYVVHQDRMADLRREADASRRAAQRPARTRQPRRLPAPRRVAAGMLAAVVAGIVVLVALAPEAAGSPVVPALPFTDLVITLAF
jgi:fatty acid desaturase